MTDLEIVTMLVEQAGIHPHPEQLELMAAVYPGVRAQVDVLYSVEAARYEDPVYDPAPVFADWWDASADE